MPPPDAVPEVLEHWVLAEAFGDRQDLIDGALHQFIDSVAEDMAPLLAAVEDRDFKIAEAMAHRLKGAALMVGAARLAEASTAIELAAQAGDWQNADAHLSALVAAEAELKQAIANKP